MEIYISHKPGNGEVRLSLGLGLCLREVYTPLHGIVIDANESTWTPFDLLLSPYLPERIDSETKPPFHLGQNYAAYKPLGTP